MLFFAGSKQERRGWIFCLNDADGRTVWQTEYGPEWSTNFERARTTKPISPNTPLLCGQHRIYLSQGYKHGSEVFEVNGSEVKRLWFEKKCDNHFQGAAFYKGRIFSSGGGTLWCFNPEDGTAVYKVEEAKKTTFCILSDDMMITYDATGGTVMLLKADAEQYKVKGSFKIEYGNDQHWSSPVVSGGILYLRHGKGIAAFAVGN